MAKDLPQFKNHEEEVRFWETANIFEYTKPADLKIDLDRSLKRTMKPAIRLRENQTTSCKGIITDL